MSKNDAFNQYILSQAKQYGAKGIILTVDSPVGDIVKMILKIVFNSH